MIYNNPNQYLSPANSLKSLENECISYLYQEDISYKDLSSREKERIELTKFMFEKQQQRRTLFHLTITYRPYQQREYSESDVNVFFKNFYIKRFLPRVMKTKNYCTRANKLIQPITFAFVDEHAPKPRINTAELSTRLHHHAILAIDESRLDVVQTLIGENTFANDCFSPIIMTSHLIECEPLRLMYSSKMLLKYPEFLSFPDKYSREHHKPNNLI